MHILVKSHEEFAACSQGVRKVLHRFGVHSTTIQPELVDMANPTTQNAVGIIMSRQGSREILEVDEDDGVGCMAQCVEDSCVDR
jgi:zinc transporter 1